MSKEIKILALIGIVVIAAAVIGSRYYKGNNDAAVPVEPAAGTNEALERPDSPKMGAENAKVTIVEFLDPECEACAQFGPIVKKTIKEYDGKVRLVIRYMPLHPNSVPAATFLEAAGEQGKYWEALELVFEKQPEWGTRHGPAGGHDQPDVGALFKGYATMLALDQAKIDQIFQEGKYNKKIERDNQDGLTMGVKQTPTLFVNGKRLDRLEEGRLKFMIDAELGK